jgi:hypothetical protein
LRCFIKIDDDINRFDVIYMGIYGSKLMQFSCFFFITNYQPIAKNVPPGKFEQQFIPQTKLRLFWI